MSRAPVDQPRGPGSADALLRSTDAGLLVAILAALASIYALDSTGSFYQRYSLIPLCHDIALFGLLAIGAAVVIIAGGIDLSVGSVVALASVLCGKLVAEWLPGGHTTEAPLPAWHVAAVVLLLLAMGALVGLAHGLLITRLKLPPFIATLATMAALRSLATLISRNSTVTLASPSIRQFGNDDRFTIPIFLGIALAASLVMGTTVLGRHLYALGGNPAAARLSGLRTRGLTTIAYVISGVLAALAGILFTGNTGQGDSRMGVAYELQAITAAVVGGCSLAGGVGSVRGTVLGLVLIQIVIKGTGLLVEGIDPRQIEGIVLGTVVVVAVALNRLFHAEDS